MIVLCYFTNIQYMLFLATCGTKTMRKGITDDNPVADIRQVESRRPVTLTKIRANHFKEVRILAARYSTAVTYEVAIGNH